MTWGRCWTGRARCRSCPPRPSRLHGHPQQATVVCYGLQCRQQQLWCVTAVQCRQGESACAFAAQMRAQARACPTTRVCPKEMAQNSGVCFSSSVASGLARADSSARTHAWLPYSAAMCKGVPEQDVTKIHWGKASRMLQKYSGGGRGPRAS